MWIEMEVEHINSGDIYFEEYEIDEGEDPIKYAEDMIDRFNQTLRPGESPRKLLGVEIISGDREKHRWEKQNLVTKKGKLGYYDSMECTNCGITGKRYTLGGNIIKDTKYKAKIYDNCSKAKKQIEKLNSK